MFKKWLRKNEQGSVMAIAAISLAVLLGFSGLAVDFGGMAMTKQELQNAADAAALAAGQDIINSQSQAAATATAKKYTKINGYTDGVDGTEVKVSYGTDTITVEITTQQDTAFTSALTGQGSTTVTAKAVARVTSAVGGFPYALFAASEVTGNKSGIYDNSTATIYGNMHSNSKISLSSATVYGSATAVAAKPTIGTVVNGTATKSLKIEMPKPDSLIAMVKANPYYVSKSVTLKNKKGERLSDLVKKAVDYFNANGGIPAEGVNIYVNGSITQNGKASSDFYDPGVPVNLVVRDGITFNGTAIASSETCPFLVLSETGDIEVNGAGAAFTGVIFAPQGDVTLNGNKAHFVGSIIAQNIVKNGGNLTVTYSDLVDINLPDGKVRLIE